MRRIKLHGKGQMKKYLFYILIFVFYLSVFSQDIQHEAIAVNIEVKVRVFKGKKFIDNLTISDFEVFENGDLQKIESVYMVKKTSIERQEANRETGVEKRQLVPQVSRLFVLIFELRNVLPKVEEAVQYFFREVIMPGDRLMIATPFKTYNMKMNVLDKMPREVIAKQLIDKVRMGVLSPPLMNRDVNDFKDLSDDADESIDDMSGMLNYMGQRYMDERRILDFAEYLKHEPGQKNVYMFLQQDLLDYAQSDMNSIEVADFMGALDWMNFMSTIASYSHIPPKKIKRAFADSSILFQFIYIKKDPNVDIPMGQPIRGSTMSMLDTSVGMFDTFKDLAQATGGLTDVSINPAASFRAAVDSSENYYLLYYSPKEYKSDGSFKNIKVKVKGGGVKIFHRSGYIAD